MVRVAVRYRVPAATLKRISVTRRLTTRLTLLMFAHRLPELVGAQLLEPGPASPEPSDQDADEDETAGGRPTSRWPRERAWRQPTLRHT